MSNEIEETKSGGRRALTIGLAGGLLAGTAAGLVFGVPGLSSAASDVASSLLPSCSRPTRTRLSRLTRPMRRRWAHGCGKRCSRSSMTARSLPSRPMLSPLIWSRADPSAARARATGRAVTEARPGMFARGVGSEALTDLLGIDAEELRTQVRDGATLAEIAHGAGHRGPSRRSMNSSPSSTSASTNAVENGRIDQTEADQKLADAEVEDHRHGQQRSPRARRPRHRRLTYRTSETSTMDAHVVSDISVRRAGWPVRSACRQL